VNDASLDIGFVVIGRNEGSRLRLCLCSVLARSSQIVYADSGSSDGSTDLAAELGIAVVELSPGLRLTAARGRNAGYKELRSRFPNCRYVQFLDGDCILQPDWIGDAFAFLEAHPEVAVVCGRRFEANPGASIYNGMADREWDTPIGEAKECGGDALMRTEAFDQVGGYQDELLAGEEPEMTARMRAAGWKIWRIGSQMTEHDANMFSLGQWWRRAQRSGFGYAQAWHATKNLPQPLYGRQLLSATAWAVGLPMVVIGAAILVGQPFLSLALLLLYALQLLRIGSRRSGKHKWATAALMLFAKLPESIGALRYLIASKAKVPEYK
jgi:GT2 family glycosyltransferase